MPALVSNIITSYTFSNGRKDDSIGIQTKWTTIFPIIPIILGLYSEEVNDCDTKISEIIHEVKAQGEYVDTDGSSQGDPSDEHAEAKAEVLEIEATAYTARCEGCIGITYSGYDVRNTVYTPNGNRVIAVDPSVIPLGSTVQITLGVGTTYVAEALDIGGDIKGMRIDFLVETYEEAVQFGRKAVKVEIISEGER